MYALTAITLFAALAYLFTSLRGDVRAAAGSSAPADRISALDIDAAGKAPRPGARDRFAMSSTTLAAAPVPSWG